MKKKIIFITEALWVGGIEIALANLLNSFDYDKYDVTCLVLRASLEVSDRINKNCRLIVSDRAKTVSFSEKYKYNRLFCLMEQPQNASKFRLFIWKCLKFFLRAPEARLYAAYVKKQLKNEHFDTAVIYSDRASESAVRAVNADKYLMFYHHGAMKKEYHDKLGYKKSEKVIAVSKKLSEKLKEYRPQFASKIIYINNITDALGVKGKSKQKPELEFQNDVFNIVSCGRLTYAKGFDVAIKAAKKLKDDGVSGFRWWIIGGGPEEAALKKLTFENGVEDSVVFTGNKSNPYSYIAQADLYVQPSRFEGHCVTVLEARILSKPILATFNAADEQIENGVTGVLCECSIDSVAENIKLLMNDKKRLLQFKENLQSHDFDEDNKNIMNELYALL
ncbi:MAG: glycosyltransferase [Oscillospiraceae bacterium]|nr:glycosyltransferase [Oscillospiraceae bacterium]